MKKSLYQIISEPTNFDREYYIKVYNQLDLARKGNSFFNKVYFGKKHDSPLLSIPSARGLIQDLKKRLFSIQSTPSKTLMRKDKSGRMFRAQIRDNKIFGAIKSIREQIQDHRRNLRSNVYQEGIHLTFGYWLRQQLDKKYQSLNESKRPKTNDPYLGIEIECIVPVDSDLKKLMLPYADYVSIVGDGSIDASEFNGSSHSLDNCDDPDNCYDTHEEIFEGREIRIMVKKSELSTILPPICGILNDIGAEVNKSCGLHVHFDMRNTTASERADIHAKLYRSLPLLTSIVPETRRKNTYCVRNKRSLPSYQGSRYRMINATAYYKHNTFEIRLFNSTTNATKIINWITLLQNIMASDMFLRCPKTFKTAQKTWKLSDELVKWCEERQEKFKDHSVPVTLNTEGNIENREGIENYAVIPSPQLEVSNV